MSPKTAGNILLITAWIPAVLSVALFLRVPWWRSELGRHLFSYMSVVALTLTLGVVRIVWEPSWFWWLRVGAFSLFVGVTWWRFLIIVKAQIDTYRERGDEDRVRQDA
jgi:hypothetical protein